MVYVGNPPNLNSVTYKTKQTALKKSLNSQNTFNSAEKWQRMEISSGMGGATPGGAFNRCVFDGRYVYYCTRNVATLVRYDTTQQFNAMASWQQIAASSATGGNTITAANTFVGCTFDGRYVYFTPLYSDTFIRYDTTQTFNAMASWQQVSMWSAQGAAVLDEAYNGCTFDGRYVYFSSQSSDGFVRFDTTLTFNAVASWEQISKTTIGTGSGYNGCTTDGRYVYFAPVYSSTLIRYDNTLSFTAGASWEKIAISSGLGGTNPGGAFNGCAFDGRYIYYCARNADTFVRFDITTSFTASSSWQQIAMASAQGGTVLNEGYQGCTFDGRYVYFISTYSTTFIRFDTTQNFTAIGSWQQVLMSVAQGGAPGSGYYDGGAFDGRYIYFAPNNSNTFIRFLANNTNTPGPIEYAQVSC